MRILIKMFVNLINHAMISIPKMDLFKSSNFEDELHRLACDSRLNKELEVHAWDHTLRVVEYSKMIIPSLSEKIIQDTLVASYFHDVGRLGDAKDYGHGMRSAEVLREKASKLFPSADFDSIIFAIEHHSDAKAPDGNYPVVVNYDIRHNVNPLIAMCLWDADRLDLLRYLEFVPRIKTEYLNTNFAKSYANTSEHKQRYYNK